jgi:ubiquinone biosynthesis protein
MKRLFRNFPRIAQVLGVFWAYFLVPYLIPKRRGNISWAVRTRLALEQLGGAWVKLGQALALRFDLLPTPFCYELFKLLNNVPAFPYGIVREIIKEELGDYPEAIFRNFEQVPFASASIGQVHRAMLPSGEYVAVKVQRPDVRRLMSIDIDLMYALGGILDRTRLFMYTPSREVVNEFSRWIVDELDYTIEARNATILYQNAQGDTLERIPKVYGKYSSHRVLTTELLEGIPLIEIMQAIQSGDTGYLNSLRAHGYSLQAIVEHIDWNMLNQMFVNGYFHADIHPANILVLPGNAIGYLDFGVVGILRDGLRESLIQYSWHLYQGNAERAVAQLIKWITPSRQTNLVVAVQELTRLHEDYQFSLQNRGDPPARNSASAFALNVLVIVRRHGMILSPGVLTYVRTLVTADTIRMELAPNCDFLAQVEVFFARLISQGAREWLDPRRLIAGVFDYGFRARQLLGLVEGQESTILALGDLFTATQHRTRSVVRWARFIATTAVVASIALLVVRASPRLMSGQLLTDLNIDWYTIGLLAAVAALVVTVLVQSRHVMGGNQQAPNTAQPALELEYVRAGARSTTKAKVEKVSTR